jgi:hypothetical protein
MRIRRTQDIVHYLFSVRPHHGIASEKKIRGVGGQRIAIGFAKNNSHYQK